MSDLPPQDLPPVDEAPPSDAPPELTPEQAAAEALSIAVQAAVKEALEAAPAWVKRLGTCSSYSPETQLANVLLDGDTAEVPCLIQTCRPNPGDRVVVEIVPGDVGSVAWVVGKVGGTDIAAGSIVYYAGSITTTTAPPSGYLWCYGQDVARATYPALFNAITTTYGAGDGSTTFTLPDLRGRMVVGMDNMGGSDAGRIGLANTLGTTGGTNTITTSHMPSHTHSTPSHSHSFSATTGNQSANHSHNSPDGTSFVTAGGVTTNVTFGGGFNANWSAGATTTTNNVNHTHSVSGTTSTDGSGTSGSAGSGSEFLPPVIVVHGCIKF